MTTTPLPLRHLSAALAAAVLACACGPRAPENAQAPPAPVANTEATDLPPTVEPTSEDLDWTVDGQDAVAATSAEAARDAREAALDYMHDGEVAGADAAVDAETRIDARAMSTEGPAPRADTRSALAATQRDGASRTAPQAAPATTTRAAEPAPPPRPPQIATASRPTAAPAPSTRGTTDARGLNQQAIGLINAGRPEQAIPVLERAVALQPRDAEMLGNLGYAYMLAGEHRRARDRLRSALDIAPARSATWLNLGQTYAELGQSDTAVDAVVTGYRYSTRKASVRSALQRAATGDRHSAQWREAAALALQRISG